MLTERERRIAQFILTVRAHLAEQCFWAYPPPLEDARPRRAVEYWPDGASVIARILADYKDPGEEFNASLELYRRYKYGAMERKWFRDHARRLAAKEMVRLHLFMMRPTGGSDG